MKAGSNAPHFIKIGLLLLLPATFSGCKNPEQANAQGLGESALLVRDADLRPADRALIQSREGVSLTPTPTAAQRQLESRNRSTSDISRSRVDSDKDSDSDSDGKKGKGKGKGKARGHYR